MTLRRLNTREDAVVAATELVASCMAEMGITPRTLAVISFMRWRQVIRLLRGRDVQVGDVAVLLHAMGYELRIERVRTSDDLARRLRRED